MSAKRSRWLLAGGILGLALSPQARRAGMGLRARATRLGRVSADPVAPFRAAPCYEHDRAEARAAAARTEAAG
ncbi:MAG TPA: hypothetical protein VK951_02400 [Miltoncostaeaceae bacterium]|nr:hypothetical protein [Miltoncostaeaceae bacterium]